MEKLSERLEYSNDVASLYTDDVRALEQALEEARAARARALADRIPFAEAYAAPVARERDELRAELHDARTSTEGVVAFLRATASKAARQLDAMRAELADEQQTIHAQHTHLDALRAALARVTAERDAARLDALRDAEQAAAVDDGISYRAVCDLLEAEQFKLKGSKP